MDRPSRGSPSRRRRRVTPRLSPSSRPSRPTRPPRLSPQPRLSPPPRPSLPPDLSLPLPLRAAPRLSPSPHPSRSTRRSRLSPSPRPSRLPRVSPPPPYEDNEEPESSEGSRPMIIAVFGKTGTGKSTFINAVTGQDLRVGHGLESCTEEVEAVRHRIGDQDVILVDTPGFDDTNVSDTDILQRIADWLRHSYDDGALLTGIIYLHRISDQRMDGASMKNLRLFRRLCGANNFRMVKLATTMWERVTEEEGARRQEQLEKEYWKDMIDRGSTVHRTSDDPQDAIALVTSFLGGPPTVLQLQDELNQGRTLRHTRAGAAIQEDIERLRVQYSKDLQEVKEEMRAAQRTRDRRYEKELKAELDRLNKKMDDMRQDEAKLQGTKIRQPNNRKRWWQSRWRCLGCMENSTRSGRWTCEECGMKQRNVKY